MRMAAYGRSASPRASASLERDRQQRVVHAHPLARAERRLHDPQRPLTHDRLLHVIQRPLGRIASMPATGQELPFAMGFRLTWERTFVEMPAR
jgi:hypothetical protein